MKRHASTFGFALTCSLLVGATIVDRAWSQPGTVLSHVKINTGILAALGAAISDSDQFGDSVANLGDLDGPGPSVVALAVGAVGDDDGGDHRGAVYILFLGSAGNVLSYQKISDTEGNFTAAFSDRDDFGGAVAALGDLDGPGPSVAALAVGAIGDDDGGVDRGAVYVLFLNAAGVVLSHQKISSTAGNLGATLDNLDEFGGALAGLGDLDGPGAGVATLAVGAVYDDDGGTDHGAVYILSLNAAGSVIARQKISDTAGNFTAVLGEDHLGEDLADLGDLDGPGPSVRALMATAVWDNDGGSDRGAAYVLFLTSTGTVLSHQKISDTAGNFTAPLIDDDNFGSAVAALGDLDGSGPSVAAVAVSAYTDPPAPDHQAVYVLFLNNAGSVLSYQEISETAGNFSGEIDVTDEFGGGMAAIGDIDGSGGAAQTLVVCAGFDDDGGLDRGAAYVLSLVGGAVVAVGDSPSGARGSALGGVRPNPFMRGTTIPFSIHDVGRARIDIWDAGGRLVRSLLDQAMVPGEHRVPWDGLDDSGRPLAPGTYFVRMWVNGRATDTGTKAILLK